MGKKSKYGNEIDLVANVNGSMLEFTATLTLMTGWEQQGFVIQCTKAGTGQTVQLNKQASPPNTYQGSTTAIGSAGTWKACAFLKLMTPDEPCDEVIVV